MTTPTEEKLAVDLIQFAESFTLDPDLDAALLHKFQQPRQRSRLIAGRGKVVHTLMMSAATLAFVALTILVIPPLRSFAQDVLRQIGAITITNAPTGYDVFSTQPTIPPDSTPIPGITPQVYEVRNLPLEEVTALTGFDVLEINCVPDGYYLSTRDVWQRNGMNSAATSYYNPASENSFHISQTIYETSALREFPVGEADIVDVTVRGVPGVWAEGVTTWPAGATLNALFWHEGVFTFIMQSSGPDGGLEMDEMIRIAESLE